MKKPVKILFVGETWTFHTTEFKGYDNFSIAGFDDASKFIEKALTGEDLIFEHMTAQEVLTKFPTTLEDIKKYDVILVSDVGSNSFLLHPDTFFKAQRTVNRLDLICKFVEEGGAFGMIGGYMTFMGIQGKGAYKLTSIEKILPVELLCGDDRVEAPQGINLTVDPSSHPILEGFPTEWPYILGYNKLIAKKDADVVVKYGEDPIIAFGEYGKGRTLAYATDCAPHWSPVEFCEWDYYRVLWQRIIKWLVRG